MVRFIFPFHVSIFSSVTKTHVSSPEQTFLIHFPNKSLTTQIFLPRVMGVFHPKIGAQLTYFVYSHPLMEEFGVHQPIK